MANNNTSMHESTLKLVGVDMNDQPRALFLYDGPWGMWKFLTGFVVERDAADHIRFAPIQTNLAQSICTEYDEPADVSTAILIDEEGSHTHSSAVLRMFLHMGFFYKWFAIVAMIVFPAFLRDAVYKQVAKNRGKIWKGVKKVTGLGDTMMEPYKNRILGVDDYPGNKEGWGFQDDDTDKPDETGSDDNTSKAE